MSNTKMRTAQAKKMLYDWLDKNRPWNSSENRENVYVLMEEIVARAALYFAEEKIYSEDEWQERERDIMRLTEDLDEHPEWYEGSCLCAECRNNSA